MRREPGRHAGAAVLRLGPRPRRGGAGRHAGAGLARGPPPILTLVLILI